MISYQAVESGARVLIEDGRYGVPWDDASEDDRAEVMARVRAILEAASPYMQAHALRDAADAMTRETPGAGPWGVPQHEHQARWLRERVAEIRSQS